MNSNHILQCLSASGDEYVSGESISRELAISRSAVWKHIQALRKEGYTIEAIPNRGYKLISVPDLYNETSIMEKLSGVLQSCQIIFKKSVASTNTVLKSMGDQGASSGTFLIAESQTAGRGRQGRNFDSPAESGIYLSMLLRPDVAPDMLSDVTAMTAVAVCNAIENICGIRPGIKWPNDIVLNGKKLAGILTELSVEWETARTDYLIIGIGINCNQDADDFQPEISAIATSLYAETRKYVNRAELVAALIRELNYLSGIIGTHNADWYQKYADACVTTGKNVRIIRGKSELTGYAVGLDKNLALIVRYPD